MIARKFDIQIQYTLDKLKMEGEMVKALWNTQMEDNMKECGRMINEMVKHLKDSITGIHTSDSLSKAKLKEMGYLVG